MVWNPSSPPSTAWSPGAPAATAWSPDTPDAGVWSPSAPAATTWTPEAPTAASWSPPSIKDADLLNGQPGSYYLDWDNFFDTPTTLAGYGITDAYTKTEADQLYALYLPLTGGTMSGDIFMGVSSIGNNAAVLAFAEGATGRATFGGGVTTGGTVLVSAGTAAAPSYSFSGEPDTGFYNYDFDSVGVSCGGVLCTQFHNAGVGIQSAQTSGNLYVLCSHVDGRAYLAAETTGTGDAYLYLAVPSTVWYCGIDNSDSDKFKIHNGALADTSLFELTTAGALTLTGGGLTIAGNLAMGGNSITGLSTTGSVQFDASNLISQAVTGTIDYTAATAHAFAGAVTMDTTLLVGSGISPAAMLHVHAPGTGAGDHGWMLFTTGDTGSTIGDGMIVGVGANEFGYVNLNEIQPLVVQTLGDLFLGGGSGGRSETIVFQIAATKQAEFGLNYFRMAGTRPIEFNDTGTYIYSSANSILNIVADGYVVVGTATTGHAIGGSGSLLVSDNLEVNDTSYFDATVWVTGQNFFGFSDAATTVGGVAFRADESRDQFIFAVRAGTTTGRVGNQVVFCEYTHATLDFDHVNQAHPTWFYQAAISPDTSNNYWGSAGHDGTGFVLTAGANTGAGSAPATIDNYIMIAPRGVEMARFSEDNGGLLMAGTYKALFNTTAFWLNSDGTNLVATSSGDFDVACGAQRTLELQTPVWDDINFGAGQAQQPASSVPPTTTFTDNEGGDTDIATVGFAVGDKLGYVTEYLHRVKTGSDFYFHVHFQCDAAPTTTDYVKWQVDYTITRDGATCAPVTSAVIEVAVDTQYEQIQAEFPVISGTGLQVNDQIKCKLSRVVAAGDAYAGAAKLVTFGIHVQIDTMGSRQILVK